MTLVLFDPIPVKKTKYSVYGGYSKASLPANIPARLVNCLVEAANMSLSKNTLRSYETAKRHIAR